MADMIDNEIQLRRKMIGLQLQTARMEAGLDLATCALWVGVSPQQLEAWEFGDEEIPFSKLAKLAARLGVPLHRFEDLPENEDGYAGGNDQVAVGRRLRKAREQAGLSPEELADIISPETLAKAEAGEIDLDAAQLSILARRLNIHLADLWEPPSPSATPEPAESPLPDIPPHVMEWLAQEEHQTLITSLVELTTLPPEAILVTSRLLLDIAMLAKETDGATE